MKPKLYMALALAKSHHGEPVKELIRGELVKVQYERAHFLPRGVVSGMEEAKERFGGSPVLEEIQGVH